MEADERRKVSLMQALATIRNEKVAIRKESAQRRKQVREGGRPAPDRTRSARIFVFALFFTHLCLGVCMVPGACVFFLRSMGVSLYVCMPFSPTAPDYVRSRYLFRFFPSHLEVWCQTLAPLWVRCILLLRMYAFSRRPSTVNTGGF